MWHMSTVPMFVSMCPTLGPWLPTSNPQLKISLDLQLCQPANHLNMGNYGRPSLCWNVQKNFQDSWSNQNILWQIILMKKMYQSPICLYKSCNVSSYVYFHFGKKFRITFLFLTLNHCSYILNLLQHGKHYFTQLMWCKKIQ